MSIPAARPPSPALPVAVAVIGVSGAALTFVLNLIRVELGGFGSTGNMHFWVLFWMGARAATLGAFVVASVAAVSLARSRRSAGAALASASFIIGSLALAIELVVMWMHPQMEARVGWRGDVTLALGWVFCVPPIAGAAGLCAAGWSDRAVRLMAPATMGAALVVGAPPPLMRWAYQVAESGTWRWSADFGDYVQVPDARLWIVPGIDAVCAIAWALGMVMVALRVPPVPSDTVAPRPPAPALRRFAVSLVAMVVVGLAAGVAIAFAQGKPASDTGPLSLAIPISVAIVTAGVGAALVNLAVTDVTPRAARFAGFAAICVFWCVGVVAAQTLASYRPRPTGGINPLLFSVFEPPWMPGIAGAIVAALALLAMIAMLASASRQAGQPPGRAQTLVILLALAIGALTTPWVLGFGTRRVAMDSLQIATLVSAVVVNLVAWIALARSAWRTALAFDGSVIASRP
ncbi:MAG TPA: hypothetical protein VM261_13510 [Kofleriaceae bacterium]|nr:hypothetical protein [Kofleriaceae bacterium]